MLCYYVGYKYIFMALNMEEDRQYIDRTILSTWKYPLQRVLNF